MNHNGFRTVGDRNVSRKVSRRGIYPNMLQELHRRCVEAGGNTILSEIGVEIVLHKNEVKPLRMVVNKEGTRKLKGVLFFDLENGLSVIWGNNVCPWVIMKLFQKEKKEKK